MLDLTRRRELEALARAEVDRGIINEDSADLDEANRSVNPNAALGLVRLMSDLSEGHYCAGWLSGLEFTLWGMLIGQRERAFGMGQVSAYDLLRLFDLAQAAGGWWRFSDRQHKQVFVPLGEWESIYARWQGEGGEEQWRDGE